jgi:8-oxo-dGTP pyrophosphatase MutT (NUDIX family)
MTVRWHALQQANARTTERMPFHVGATQAGPVARVHLAALRTWPRELVVSEHGVWLQGPPQQRDAELVRINVELRRQGLVRAWRDETFDIVDPATGAPLAHTERAAARFWGTLTRGTHANGYLTRPGGRASHLWIAQRSLEKATDPGLFDNLIGGGVARGQTPHEALVREGLEEAGLSPQQMRPACAAGVLRLHRDVPEGLQLEDLHAFDLPLPAGQVPTNQDGEVAGFTCMPAAQALALAATARMTVDAALVTLDFGDRHGLLAADAAMVLRMALTPLRRGPGAPGQPAMPQSGPIPTKFLPILDWK